MKNLFQYLIYLLLFISCKTSFAQIEVTDWQTGKKLYIIKENTLRAWSTNEALFEFRDDAFYISKTGEKVYSFGDKRSLWEVKTGRKIFEYKDGKIISSVTGKMAFEIDKGDKSIIDSQSRKKLITISRPFIYPEFFYMILIASDLIK